MRKLLSSLNTYVLAAHRRQRISRMNPRKSAPRQWQILSIDAAARNIRFFNW